VAAGATLVDIQERTRATSSPELEFLTQQKTLVESRLAQLRLDFEDNLNSSETQTIILSSKIEQIEEQLSSAKRALVRRKDQFDLAKKQFERKKTLFAARDITLPEYEDAQQRLNESEKSVDDTNSDIFTIKVSLNTAKVELNKYGNIKTRQRIQKSISVAEEEISDINTKMRDSQNLVEGVTYDNSVAQYRSKASGQVTRLLVSEEQLVSTGAPLVMVIPEGSPLEARGLIRNDAIGKLRRLQDVKLKYFAFPFQEYGIAAGKIKSISTIPSELKGEDGSYAIIIAIDEEYVSKRDGKRIPLSIGLAGAAEVKVGEKRLIEILFGPVSKFLEAKEF
jgi:multidrug resistance efflux pump